MLINHRIELKSGTSVQGQALLYTMERLLEAHQRIADAIEGHDKATARLWVEKHIRDFHRGYKVTGLNMNEPVLPLNPKLFQSYEHQKAE